MTLGEKTDSPMNQHSSLPLRYGSAESAIPANSNNYSFSDVVDQAFEGLMNRQIKYSLRRIQEMEKRVSLLERELDDFLDNSIGDME